MSQQFKNLKLVVLGDGATGKTCLFIQYTTHQFPQEYVPTVFDNYSQNLNHRGTMVCLGLWDTAGGEDYDRLRPLSYPQTDIFLLCFNCVSRASFQNIRTKWWPEIQHHMPNVPFLLVATKVDLRQSPDMLDRLHQRGESLITFEEGESLAKEIGAAAYCESSALTGEGVDQVFETAMDTVVNPQFVRRIPMKKACSLL